eukprot:COSAG04_NODE_284_length_18146_cov_3.266789_3_plen_95_part_00
MDSSRRGNVSRFLNHSCSPNLEVVQVMQKLDDASLPDWQVGFFTTRDVKAGEELAYGARTKTFSLLSNLCLRCIWSQSCSFGRSRVESLSRHFR